MMISQIVNFVAKPLANMVGQWQSRKTLAAQIEGEKVKNDLALKKAITQAKIQRITAQDNADLAYDIMVMENRKHSIMDDILITFWLVIFAMHFVPVTAPYMLNGWQSILKSPWWYQFGMLGILISTLGLMRLFRMYTERRFTLRKGA